MTDLNRRLRRLEQRQTEAIIEAKIDAMAKEYGLSRAEILAEAEAVQAYYEKHGHWPLDVDKALQFYEEHGRLPTLEEWPDVHDGDSTGVP
jgi:hypothetical protein